MVNSKESAGSGSRQARQHDVLEALRRRSWRTPACRCWRSGHRGVVARHLDSCHPKSWPSQPPAPAGRRRRNSIGCGGDGRIGRVDPEPQRACSPLGAGGFDQGHVIVAGVDGSGWPARTAAAAPARPRARQAGGSCPMRSPTCEPMSKASAPGPRSAVERIHRGIARARRRSRRRSERCSDGEGRSQRVVRTKRRRGHDTATAP